MSKKSIYNLNDLITALDNQSSSGNSYEEILDKIKFEIKDIEHLCFWDADSYSKINVGSGDHYTLDLICWEKEQKSPIHNHEITNAWAYVLKGKVAEKLYSRIEIDSEFNLDQEMVMEPNTYYRLNHNKELFHQLVNSNQGRSVSLHLYVK